MKRVFLMIISLTLTCCLCGCFDDRFGESENNSRLAESSEIETTSDKSENISDLISDSLNDMSEDMSDETSANEEILIPTEEDFKKFEEMSMIYIGCINYSNQAFETSIAFYGYFGYKTERIEIQSKYVGGFGDEIWDAEYSYEYDWDDPLDKFHFNDGGGAFWFGDVVVYDISALNWIGENVIGEIPNIPENDYCYSYQGKYYEVNHGENIGHPGVSTDITDRSYELIKNNEYKLYLKCAEEDWAYETVELNEYFIVAKLKNDENHGRYWEFISCDHDYGGTITFDEYFNEE